MNDFSWDDPATADPLGFSQTTRKEPLVVHWSIEPEESKPPAGSDAAKENRPAWKITVHLEAPPDWTLATASSGTSVIERISSQPLVLSFDFKQLFPPLGPGPSLDTQWKTPGGPVFFRLEPEMTLAAITEIAPEEPVKVPRSALSGSIPWLLGFFVFLVVVFHFWRRRQGIEAMARKWHATTPSSSAPWPEWEIWLARVERQWKEWNEKKKEHYSPAWTELGAILPQARFGRPQNSALDDMMGKIKILGRLDNLAKLGSAGRR